MTNDTNTGQLEIKQRYPHPVARVFDAWSDPSKVKPWWGPMDFTATKFEADFRPGGAWDAIIVGPDGQPMSQSGRYTRIDRNRLIAFTFQWGDDDSPQTDVTVTFTDEGDSTLVTFQQSPFTSDESRSSHEAGWQECLERLDDHLQENNA